MVTGVIEGILVASGILELVTSELSLQEILSVSFVHSTLPVQFLLSWALILQMCLFSQNGNWDTKGEEI